MGITRFPGRVVIEFTPSEFNSTGRKYLWFHHDINVMIVAGWANGISWHRQADYEQHEEINLIIFTCTRTWRRYMKIRQGRRTQIAARKRSPIWPWFTGTTRAVQVMISIDDGQGACCKPLEVVICFTLELQSATRSPRIKWTSSFFSAIDRLTRIVELTMQTENDQDLVWYVRKRSINFHQADLAD